MGTVNWPLNDDGKVALDTFLWAEVFRAAFDLAQEGVIITDTKGVIRYVNPAYTVLCGYTAEERIGQNVFETNPKGALTQCLRTGRPVKNSHYRTLKTGIAIVANAFPLHVENSFVGGIIFFQDVSEVIRLSNELSQINRKADVVSDKLLRVAKAKVTFADLVGTSNPMQRTVELAQKVARSDSSILLRGETGTGKDLFAQAIHNASSRSERPFIAINCAAIPDNLLESELFGYEKGAFTGASQRKLGAFDLADTGTVFLDEIGDMSLSLQAKILRVLQDGEYWRLGGTEHIRTDIRVIAATNRPLDAMMAKGAFRQDLYYRLSVVEIYLPPLRERKSDIPLLANSLVRKLSRRVGKPEPVISPSALQALCSYKWPGNVRELENALERSINLAENSTITADTLLIPKKIANGPGEEGIMPLREMEQLMVKKALARFGTTLQGKKEAAKALKISLATLYSKLKEINIDNL